MQFGKGAQDDGSPESLMEKESSGHFIVALEHYSHIDSESWVINTKERKVMEVFDANELRRAL